MEMGESDRSLLMAITFISLVLSPWLHPFQARTCLEEICLANSEIKQDFLKWDLNS